MVTMVENDILQYHRFFFAGVYVPNSGRGLVNLEKRGEWEVLLREKLSEMDQLKPVIYAGDLNVAHEEIGTSLLLVFFLILFLSDLANPASNKNKTAGFTDQERADMTSLLDCGFVDTFRQLHGQR